MNGRTNVTGGGSNGSLGGVIPLEAPSNFTVTPDNGKCLLTWTDPKDKYADEIGEITDEGDQLVSQFAYTRIVRKQGSAPSSPNDGDLVTDSSTRNQYQSSAYVDDGLTNNTLYYYAAFTCNTDAVYSGAAIGSGTPKSYDPILANNTWEQINDVANEGIASSVWNIGDEIDIQVLSEAVTACIIDFDHDTLADGSGKAAITFSLKTLPNTKYYVWTSVGDNPRNVNYFNSLQWSWYNNTLFPSITQYARTVIKPVKKTAVSLAVSEPDRFNDYTYWIQTTRTVDCNIFPFAIKELNLSPSETEWNQYADTEGFLYPYYSTIANRIKMNSSGSPMIWNLRTCDEHSQDQAGGGYIAHINYVSTSGNRTDHQIIEAGRTMYGICFGFCIGKTPA